MLIDLFSTNRPLLERLAHLAKKEHWADDGTAIAGAMQTEPDSGL